MIDSALMGEATSRPGNDTRQWISLGTVVEETSGTKSVEFKDETGTPLPSGPMVRVTLQPSNIRVLAMVGQQVVGNGEGEWVPFIQGDQVLVALPSGDENFAPTIICRVASRYDPFPTAVAGQDPTKNTFAFKRRRTPYIEETASSWMVRSAITGAQVAIDQQGALFLSTGDKHHFILNADVMSWGNAENTVEIQLQVSDKNIIMSANTSRVELMSSGQSLISSAGPLAITGGGASAKHHEVSLEQVINLFVNFLYLLTGPAGSSTLQSELSSSPVKLLFAGTFPQPLITGLTKWLTDAAITPTPITPVAGGAVLAPISPVFLGLGPLLLSPLATVDITGIISPGIGNPNIMLGG